MAKVGDKALCYQIHFVLSLALAFDKILAVSSFVYSLKKVPTLSQATCYRPGV